MLAVNIRKGPQFLVMTSVNGMTRECTAVVEWKIARYFLDGHVKRLMLFWDKI